MKLSLSSARKSLVLGLMGLVALGLTAAMAASSDGAIVINDHQCFDASGGYTICYDLHVEGNQTTAASGNVSLEQNGFVNQSLIDPSGNTVASATQPTIGKSTAVRKKRDSS